MMIKTIKTSLFWVFLLSILISACGLPEGVRVESNPLAAALERKYGLIAFIGTDGNVYTVNQAGEELTAITSDAAVPSINSPIIRYYQALAWSPDSQSLAYVRLEGNQDNPSQNNATLITRRLDGEIETELFNSTDQFPFYLYWTPDGSQISFLANTPDRANNVLRVVSASGGQPTILDTGSPYYWSWAPNGGSLLLHAGGNSAGQSSPRLSFVTPAEDRVVETLISETPNIFPAPTWTPDGSQYLMAELGEGNQVSLVLVDKDGSKREVLMTSGFPIVFGLSPDGKTAAVIVRDQLDHLPRGPLYIFDLDNPEEKFVTEEGNVGAFFWSPDSSKLAYLPYARTQLQTSAEEGEAPQTIEVGLLSMKVYVRDDEKAHEVLNSFLPSEGFLSMLQFFDQYNQSATIWSPDNRNMVIAARNFQGQNLVMMVTASGNIDPRYIADGVFSVWSWE